MNIDIFDHLKRHLGSPEDFRAKRRLDGLSPTVLAILLDRIVSLKHQMARKYAQSKNFSGATEFLAVPQRLFTVYKLADVDNVLNPTILEANLLVDEAREVRMQIERSPMDAEDVGVLVSHLDAFIYLILGEIKREETKTGETLRTHFMGSLFDGDAHDSPGVGLQST